LRGGRSRENNLGDMEKTGAIIKHGGLVRAFVAITARQMMMATANATESGASARKSLKRRETEISRQSSEMMKIIVSSSASADLVTRDILMGR
jgi:hypothetical protein